MTAAIGDAIYRIIRSLQHKDEDDLALVAQHLGSLGAPAPSESTAKAAAKDIVGVVTSSLEESFPATKPFSSEQKSRFEVAIEFILLKHCPSAASPTLQAEIMAAWARLEDCGFPPEASGFPSVDLAGKLPAAIDAALDCLIRQREDLLKEVLILRARHAPPAGLRWALDDCTKALKQHHDWHLAQGTEVIEGIELNKAEAYGDSKMHEDTVRALHAAGNAISVPVGRDPATLEAATQAVRAACSMCDDGHARGEPQECEYCGRPMAAIRALGAKT